MSKHEFKKAELVLKDAISRKTDSPESIALLMRSICMEINPTFEQLYEYLYFIQREEFKIYRRNKKVKSIEHII